MYFKEHPHCINKGKQATRVLPRCPVGPGDTNIVEVGRDIQERRSLPMIMHPHPAGQHEVRDVCRVRLVGRHFQRGGASQLFFSILAQQLVQ